MFSTETFFDARKIGSLSELPEVAWRDLATAYRLQAILVAELNAEGGFVEIRWAFGVPKEPFNGTDSKFVTDAIAECFKIHPKPHVHSMAKGTLSERICQLKQGLIPQYKMWFFPVKSENRHLVFLAFPFPGEGDGFPKDIQERLVRTLLIVDASSRANELIHHVEVTERFVKEVGHDLASSVQATIAKLRNISEGRITGDGIAHKTREIEQEIWAAYQSADSLGMAVGAEYELRRPEDFDLATSVDTVLVRFGSEAAERNVWFERKYSRIPKVWGEKQAVEQAVGQVVSNAIKYSYGGNAVIVGIWDRADDFVIKISNKGIQLPAGYELKQIWDFGFRGRNAIERHVNGSGIGLYTVKKVISAHRGWVDVQAQGVMTEFFLHIPKRAILQRELGYLI